jgi:hypothetical protein
LRAAARAATRIGGYFRQVASVLDRRRDYGTTEPHELATSLGLMYYAGRPS